MDNCHNNLCKKGDIDIRTVKNFSQNNFGPIRGKYCKGLDINGIFFGRIFYTN